jgi:hypothetical protein
VIEGLTAGVGLGVGVGTGVGVGVGVARGNLGVEVAKTTALWLGFGVADIEGDGISTGVPTYAATRSSRAWVLSSSTIRYGPSPTGLVL